MDKKKILLIGEKASQLANLISVESKYQVILYNQTLGIKYPNPLELSKDILTNEKYIDNKQQCMIDLFVIDLDYNSQELPTDERQPYENIPGILLLKYLRLRGVYAHVCLIGCQLETVLRNDPRQFIIASQSVSNLPELPNKDDPRVWDWLETVMDETEQAYALKQYFKHEDDFMSNQHRNTNLWSPIQLYKVHRIIEEMLKAQGDSQTSALSYQRLIYDLQRQPQLKKPLEFFDSYRGLVMQLLYGLKDEPIRHELKKLRDSQTKTQEGLATVISQSEGQSTLSPYAPPTSSDKGNWKQRLCSWAKSLLYQIWGSEPKTNPKQAPSKQNAANTYKQQIEKLQDDYNTTINDKCQFLSAIIKSLRKRKPSILLIDDKAQENGWGYIYEQMIYGDSAQEASPNPFHIYQPKESETIEEMAKKVKEILSMHHIDLILLDLRLKDETTQTTVVHSLSGIELLKKLTDEWLPIPIIVATASKKHKFHTVSLKHRAIYFWTKPSIEEASITANVVVEAYYRLLRTINTLVTNRLVQFVYKEFIPSMSVLTTAERLLNSLNNESPEIAEAWSRELLGFSLWSSHDKYDKTDFLDVIKTCFDVVFFKMQQEIQAEHTTLLSKSDLSLPIFLLGFCFDRKVSIIYDDTQSSQNFSQEKSADKEAKLVLVQKLLVLLNQTVLPHRIYQFIHIRNENTHHRLVNEFELGFYIRHFFNALYTEPQNIGLGIENILIQGTLKDTGSADCLILKPDDEPEELRVIVPTALQDKVKSLSQEASYLFLLERRIEECNTETASHSMASVTKSYAKLEFRGPKDKPIVYYYHDLRFHRNLFFQDKCPVGWENKKVKEYNLSVTYRLKKFYKFDQSCHKPH